jgi:endo-1,4-beta-D-glucanase Y
MAYMNQERKAKIATALKPILAKYKMKGTLRTRQHAITLTLRSGPVDFIQDLQTFPGARDKNELRKDYHLNINQYHYKTNYEGVSAQFIDEANTAMMAADYYDNSDIMTDYFSTAYYYDITVGTWEKPYEVVNSI